MLRAIAGWLLVAAAVPALAQSTPGSLKAKPAAQPLFERDWVLMNWALKLYDANRDILLEPEEAQAAAAAFRTLADTNKDGRVTPVEYRAARQLILEQG